MKKYLLILCLVLVLPSQTLFCGDELSFDEAVERVFLYSPDLRISSSEIDGKTGQQIQSLLYPNPVFSYSVENVMGNKRWHIWESAETRYEIAQLIELGGKRDYRFNLASYQKAAAEAGYEAKKISVLNRLLKAFIEVAYTQEQTILAREQLRVAEEVSNTVSSKVEAGKVSYIQKNKSEIAFATAQFKLNRALVDYAKAKDNLSILWGAPCPDFQRVAWDFYLIETPKTYEICHSLLGDHPALIQAHLDYLAANQNLNLQKAEAVPDLIVTVGYKTEQHNQEKGMVFGAALPLPIFNQNQGNIAVERSKVMQYQEQYNALLLFLENKLSTTHKELMRAFREAEQLRSTVLKAAEQAFQFAQEGYSEGKFEYLDLLDSQRTLFDIKEDYIEALFFYHISRADIEYLNSQDQ